MMSFWRLEMAVTWLLSWGERGERGGRGVGGRRREGSGKQHRVMCIYKRKTVYINQTTDTVSGLH